MAKNWMHYSASHAATYGSASAPNDIRNNLKILWGSMPPDPLALQGSGSVSCTRNTIWQSRVEIEHQSVAYFERVTAFEAL